MKKWLLLGLLCLGAGDPYVEIEKLVRENFYDRSLGGLNWSQLCREQAALDPGARAINALLERLHASHTHFYASDSQAFHELCGIFPALKLAAPYRGPGWFLMETSEGRCFVKNVWPGFPAASAGLKVGDEILDVDGHSPWEVDHLSHRELALVSIRRRAGAQPEQLRIPLRAIDPMAAFVEVEKNSARLLGKTAYVAIPCFAGQSFQDTLSELLFESPLREASGLVLDLRDGWGGADPVFLNLFNPRVPGLELEFRDGKRTSWDRQWRKPVVLLVNAGTTSGKEIYAYGLQKYGLGKIVGQPTAGAVLAGRPYLLSSGGILYLAVADARVDGERLEGRGVTPDLEVAREIPFCAGADPQLDAALELLARMYTK